MNGFTIAGLQVGWGGIFGVLNLILGGGAFATWLKNRPKMRELEHTAEAKLRDDLIARVEKLEAKLEQVQNSYEAKLAEARASYDASLALLRHELNNVRTCFNALVMLLKRMPNPPEALAGILADIEAMRADQMKAEALEKGAVRGSAIAASLPRIDLTD